MTNRNDQFSFRSDAGYALLRQITENILPYHPHDVSIETVASILDWHDILVRTACGSGKTGIIALLALALPKIHEQTVTYKPWFHEDPVLLVICPTNALEIDIESKLEKLGVNAVALNSDVILTSQLNNTTSALWTRVQNCRVLLISPELLQRDLVRDSLQLSKENSLFKKRCSLLVVDEIHLVYEWGQGFRESYRYIGEIRAQLHSSVRLLGLTATLQNGGPLGYVLKTFGLREGQYIDIHQSNLRPEIRIITSTLESNLSTSYNFPELLWALGPALYGITIIFTPNRSSALRITLYLRRSSPSLAVDNRIRKWDSLNDSSYDQQTLDKIQSLNPQTDRLIIVSTTILMVGVDFQGVNRIINLEPDGFDKEIQMEGRMRGEGESYVYFSRRTFCAAAKRVEEEEMSAQASGDPPPKKKKTGNSGKKSLMDIEWARRIHGMTAPSGRLVKCRSSIQNRVYNNPSLDLHICGCPDCTSNPRPKNPPCICDDCRPGECWRDRINLAKAISIAAIRQRDRIIRPSGPLTIRLPPMSRSLDAQQRAIVSKILEDLDGQLFDNNVGNSAGIYLPGMFIKPVIPDVLRHFFEIQQSKEVLDVCLKKYALLPEWSDALWTTISIDITCALDEHQRNHEEERTRKEREVAEAKKQRLLTAISEEDFAKFLEHLPTLQKENLVKLGKQKLTWELRWHKLWNNEARSPWGLSKEEIIIELRRVIDQFVAESRTVEEVRAHLRSRQSQN